MGTAVVKNRHLARPALVELLDRLEVAREIKARPGAYVVLLQRGDKVVLEESAWE